MISPYKGLAAFDDSELDALLFFGREGDTEIIAANLVASRFTVLYGPAGVGKSSVLRAGVAPRMRSLAPDALVVVADAWSADAVEGIWSAVAATAPGAARLAPDAALADRLSALADWHGGHVYLVLDQFEEVFTYSAADALATVLAEVVTRPKLRLNVLLALRDDALAELDVFTGLIPDVFGNYIAVEPLEREAGRAAITGPVARFNELSDDPAIAIEPELVDAVLDEVEIGRVVLGGVARGTHDAVSGGAVEAPYLQLVMQRLWEEERARGSTVLRRATLAELGGAHEIVRAHLERALDSLAPVQRDVAARVFHHLVTPSGTKVAHRTGDLAQYAGVREDELRPVLSSLGADRILRPLDGRFEIYHDVLADAVLAWRSRHAAGRAVELERAEAKRRQRRLVVLLAASLLGAAAMAAAMIYALTQRAEARDEAQRAEAGELDAVASALIPVTPPQIDPELGLLLAAEAARLSPSERAADILRRALLVSHLRRVLPERRVTTALFSPRGDRIPVGTAGGVARVYTADGRTQLGALRVGRPVTGAAASPDGRLVLTTERDGPARMWDAATGEALRAFGDTATVASFSSDGSRVLTVEGDRARVWRTGDASAIVTLPQPEPVLMASFSPDGRLVTTGAGRTVRVFDSSSGRRVAAVDHGADVTSASVTRHEQLVTTGRDGTARVWALRGGGRLVHELRGHRGQVTAGAVSPDGSLLVTTSTDSTARVWALPSGSFVAVLRGHTNHVTGAAWSRDSSSIVTWSTDGTARVWEPDSGRTRVVLAGSADAITDASFDRSGDVVLTTGSDGRARIWRSRVDDRLRLLARVTPPVGSASFNADGSVVAVAGKSGISLMRTADARRTTVLPVRGASVLAVSRDGTLVAAARGRQVSVLRAATGEPVGSIEEDADVTALTFAPDARRVAVGTARGTIRIWATGGHRAATLRPAGRRVTSLAFAPSGKRVAAGLGNGALAVWDVEGRRRLSERVRHRPGSAVMSVAYSRDGRRVVTAGRDSTVRVWTAATGEESYALHGHFAVVSDASFSRDGRWVVSAGPGTAGLWHLASRQRLLFLHGHIGRLLAASFDARGRKIVTVGVDGTVRAYACEVCGGIEDLLRLAGRRLAATNRKITQRERRRYLGD